MAWADAARVAIFVLGLAAGAAWAAVPGDTPAQAAAGPMPPAPPPPPPPPPLPPVTLPDGWRKEGSQFDGELAEAAYRALLQAPWTWRMRPTTGRGDLITDVAAQSFVDGLVRFEAYSGEWVGTWLFLPPAALGRWPRAAIRIRPGTQAPYSVVVDYYCKPSQCAKLREQLASAWLPRPLAEDGSTAMRAWQQLVRAEACVPGGPHQPPPAYPPQELMAGVSGSASLLVFTNRCGDVRDVRVVKSTGNRSLDRAAIQAARSWRVPTEYEGRVVEQAIVPVTFLAEEALPPGIVNDLPFKE